MNSVCVYFFVLVVYTVKKNSCNKQYRLPLTRFVLTFFAHMLRYKLFCQASTFLMRNKCSGMFAALFSFFFLGQSSRTSGLKQMVGAFFKRTISR